jgi:acetyl coenzyme A synthetase (ADP forming)-like protein
MEKLESTVKEVAPDRTIMLRDGAVLRMRALVPSDRSGLIELFNRCSPETRRYRFLRMINALPDLLLDQLVTVDGDHHVALVILQGADAKEKIVAVGRYHALDDRPEVAEVSFLIEDAMQKRGLGTALLDALAEIARQHGITRFAADVLADNRLMLSVFRKAGYGLSSNISYGVTHLEFPIARTATAEARMEAQESEAGRASLQSVFAPRSIAVIGASREPGSVGGALFRNLLRWGFNGTVYPVNPAARSVAGVRAYADVAELPEVPDLAFIAVPSREVIEVARRAASSGVRALCVLSAGFAETGEEGAAAQALLLGICRAHGMRLIGPNCMGVVNTAAGVRMLGTFAPAEPPAGNVAMSSQSGALGLALMAQAGQLGLGVSSFISVGNKADVSGNDLLLFWEGDEATDVILLYLENFGNPRRFARIARRVSRAKPIVAVKSGRTKAGARAASSHTAALANSDRAVEALFHQTGIIRVDTLYEFFAVARLLAAQPIPRGRRVGILTNAGGPAVLAVDAAEAAGLEVPVLKEEIQERLREHLAKASSSANPVDMIAHAGPEQYRRCLDILLDDPDLDAILVIFIPPLLTPSSEVARAISELIAGRPASDKTILAVFLDPHSPVTSIAAGARQVPVYPFPEGAVAALGAAVRYGLWRAAPTGNLVEIKIDREAVQQALHANPEEGWLAPVEVAKFLNAAGIEIAMPAIVRSKEEAGVAAASSGAPVALKVSMPAVMHKSDVDGVILNVAPQEGAAAYERLGAQLAAHGIALEAASVMPMARPGIEILAGVTHDPLFGPLVAFGSGGFLVELLEDIVFRVLPLTDRDAKEMIGSTRAAKLLRGYRGTPPADIAAVEQLLLRLGALAEAFPRVTEIDLNPVIVHPEGEGLSLIDARLKLARA